MLLSETLPGSDLNCLSGALSFSSINFLLLSRIKSISDFDSNEILSEMRLNVFISHSFTAEFIIRSNTFFLGGSILRLRKCFKIRSLR